MVCTLYKYLLLKSITINISLTIINEEKDFIDDYKVSNGPQSFHTSVNYVVMIDYLSIDEAHAYLNLPSRSPKLTYSVSCPYYNLFSRPLH